MRVSQATETEWLLATVTLVFNFICFTDTSNLMASGWMSWNGWCVQKFPDYRTDVNAASALHTASDILGQFIWITEEGRKSCPNLPILFQRNRALAKHLRNLRVGLFPTKSNDSGTAVSFVMWQTRVSTNFLVCAKQRQFFPIHRKRQEPCFTSIATLK